MMSLLIFLATKEPEFLRSLFTEKFWNAVRTLGPKEFQVVQTMFFTGWYVDLIRMMSVNKAFHEWFLSDIKPLIDQFILTPKILKIQDFLRYQKIHCEQNLSDSRNFSLLDEKEKKTAAWRLCLRDSRNVFDCSPEILDSFSVNQWLVLVNKDARTYERLPDRIKTHAYVGEYFVALLHMKCPGYYNYMIPWAALELTPP